MAKDEVAATKDGKKQVAIRLDPELYALIEKEATADERSMSQYIERHLRRQFTKPKQATEPVSTQRVPPVSGATT